MKIGIDAKWYYNGPPSGHVVVKNLVNELIRINSEHELHIILRNTDKGKPFPFKNENLYLHYIWAGNNLVSNLLVVPKVAKKYSIDVLVYQNFASITNEFKQISYIHDIIFLTHPQYYTFWERTYFAPLKYLAKKSNLICTVSNSEKKRIVEYYGITPEKIDVIHHGVQNIFQPVDQYSPNFIKEIRSRYKLPKDFLLYVGRLNVRKNISNLLYALPLLCNKEIPLVIVGAYDWKKDDVERIISKLKIRSRIIFTGPVLEEELAGIYSLAKLFCFPSFEEGFGLPPLEAMASGVPVVVPDSSSIPEICGDAGNYVDAHSPKNIASMIDLLLTDKELYQKKRRLGLERAKQFTWKNSALKLLESCKKAVNQPI